MSRDPHKPLSILEKDILICIQKRYPVSGCEIATVYKILGSYDMTIKCLDYALYYAESTIDAAHRIKKVIDKFKS